MKRFDYCRPTDLKEAFSLMEKSEGRAKYIAGGTDLLIRIKHRTVEPDTLISLRGVDSLRGIAENGAVIIGSMTPFREIERHRGVARNYPALTRAAWWLANPQVRNVATIGGNLCNAAPSADSAPPLLVTDAMLTLEGPGGERKVPVEDFFAGPGETCLDATEVLTRIEIPKTKPHTGMAFLKLGRVAQDIAVVNAAALLVAEDGVCRKCRLAVGAVAPVPLRLKDVEEFVEGERIRPELLREVRTMVEGLVRPITDVRSTEEYRRSMSGVLATRAIEQAIKNI